MKKYSVSAIAEMKEVFAKSQYIKREWKTAEDDIIPLEDYVELIDPTMGHISGNPTVIAKPRKDGNFFLKLWIPLEGGSGIESDLSFENDFDEGDELDKGSLCFCMERFLDKTHGYVTGELA